MIVTDASTAVEALLGDESAQQLFNTQTCFVPHLADVEVAHALRRLTHSGRVDSAGAAALVNAWKSLGVTRFAMFPLLDRIWQLRANLTSYDACYVALAEELGCALVTADARIAHAPQTHCEIQVLGDD